MILVVELGETEWFARNSESGATEFKSPSFKGLAEWLTAQDNEYVVTRDSEEPFYSCYEIILGLVVA